MRCLSLFAAAAAVLVLSAAPTLADRAKADACAAGLPPDARLVYSATIGDVKPGADIAASLQSRTRSLVMGGKLGRAQAKPAAQAAAGCLKLAL